MDKREALEIYLKAHDECLEHTDCKDCAFHEVFGGSPMCILGETGYTPVAQWIRKKFKWQFKSHGRKARRTFRSAEEC